ncbi:XrtA/PEP-CTERM system TPR-repeat protein PrsT [Massilia sp. DWR3-1-1]|uniref:XrtA/PEP-CTERM system TPR-repeat protein PrsT n=1 Tax=Massilia sp. DWR3-1-1 TaxID=2804559 RepID=UPI003CF65E87
MLYLSHSDFRPALLGAALAGAFLLGGCAPASHDEVRAKALAYQKKGDLNAAVIVLKTSLESAPKDGEFRLLLARVYLDQGDPVSAEKEIRLAMAANVAIGQTSPVLGRALNLQGQFQKALDETQRDVGSKDPELLCLRGDAYLALSRPEDARQLYQFALETKPNYVNALIGLGRLAFLNRDLVAANRYSIDAIASQANSTDAQMFRGDLLRAENKTAEALAAYDKALAINPFHRTANVEKAYLDIGVGDYPAATRELVAARKIAPGSLLVAYSQALLDFSMGKNVEAQDQIRTVLRVAPEHMPSLLLAGAAALNLGSLHQAEHHLRHYLEKHPDNVYARKMLAQSLLKRGDSPAALAVLEPALQNGPKDVQLLALAGESYMQAANYDQAGQYFERASALDPKAASLRMSLAMSRLGKGNATQAIDDLQMATQLDSKSPKAGIALIRTEMNLGNYPAALKAAVALEQQQSANPTVLDLKGLTYIGLNDLVQARAAFESALKAQANFFPAVANLVQLDIRAGKTEAASARLKAFLAANPNNVDAMTALANMAVEADRQQEATDWLLKAVAVDPTATTPSVNLISQYLKLKQTQKALDVALQLKVSHADDPDLLDLMGKAQLANGDLDGATDSYRKLTVALPRSAQAQMQLGALLMVTKKDSAAEEVFKSALSIQPDFPAAQLALIELYVRKGWHGLALQQATRIIRAHPESAAGYQLSADVLQADGKLAEAMPMFEKALAIARHSEALVKLASALRAGGKNEEAARRVSAWLQQHPKDMRVEMYRAECALNDKQYAAAAAQYESIVAHYPKNLVVLNNLAMSYHLGGDKRAVATADQAYTMAGEQPMVMDTLGWILVQQGNVARGLPLLLRASVLAPQAHDIRLHVAQGLIKSGDRPAARKELEAITGPDIRFAQVDEARALLAQLRQ